MFAIFRNEVRSFLTSLVGYVVMGVFLTALGLLLWVFPDTSLLNYGYAELGQFFNLTPYVFLFLVPAITMRAFAEERRNGTLELLLTKPITDWQLVLGKFLACWFLIFLTLLPTLIYYASIYQLGNPAGNVDSAEVDGSYLGLWLLGGVFAAIGLATSALTDSQVVAFLLGVFACFLAYVGISAVAGLESLGSFGYFVGQLGLDAQYSALGRGLIDSRNVVYLLTWIALGLLLTRWRVGVR